MNKWLQIALALLLVLDVGMRISEYLWPTAYVIEDVKPAADPEDEFPDEWLAPIAT